MPTKTTLAAALPLLCAAILDSAAAQDVILGEFARTGSAGWIELHNRGGAAADVSGWSIYLATATPGQPQTYWWGFRSGTVIAPGQRLVVRWLAPVPATPVPGEVATGATPYDFLFSLGAEQLPLQRGALALLRSQQNADMNSAAIIADWVSWGSGGLSRETLAQQAGVWVAGHATAPLASGSSLARFPGQVAPASPELAWFLDTTPTPGADNVGAAETRTVGVPCAPIGHHLLGAPVLTATSVPVLGNAAFGLRVANTTGVLLEQCWFVFTFADVPAGNAGLLPPVPGTSCLVYVDPATLFLDATLHSSVGATVLPLSLADLPPALAGISFAVQALVQDGAATWPPFQGVTNALAITLGS
jgi:hypothetical protein